MTRILTRARRGVALLLVIGFVALLSLLITGLMDTLRVRLVENEARAQRADLRDAAESALAVAAARLAVFENDAVGFRLNAADLDRLALDPLAGWTSPAGVSVSVLARDESGRFALNTTDTPALRRLFEDLGIATETAATLADSLADAIDPDDARRLSGAEAGDYGSPNLPPNRRLTGFADLRTVKGFAENFFRPDGTPNDSGLELASVCTFLDTGPAPHLNGAPDAVLRMLCRRCGADEADLRTRLTPLDYPADRTHRGVIRSAAELPQAGAPPALARHVSFGCRLVRVTIRATKGDLRHDIDALLAPNAGSDTAPVRLVRRLDGARLADDEAPVPEAAPAAAP